MSSTPSILSRNLTALSLRNPDLANQIASAEPARLDWVASKKGLLSAQLLNEDGSAAGWLASRFDPAAEAGKLADKLDRESAACAVVLGFGIGYHVEQIAERIGPKSILVVFEPDLGLLRAVFEKIDHARWIAAGCVLFFDKADDGSDLTGRMEGLGGVITQGTQILTHPGSRARQAEAFSTFSKTFTQALAFFRTTVATALVNSARTCRNLVNNLGHYVAGSTIAELHNAAAGYPAVCVAAGPSLVRNVDLLRDPDVRSRLVVIAAQTALRPLLDRGIRPDFVTALDYSPICTRFYEDLPDLPDVTLVAEPKAHPRILEVYPGPIRIIGSEFNDKLIGDLKRTIPPMSAAGSTVAHLSFYLAQYLGCDPIMLMGQDLGFSDGLYYAPGTAVHRVWSSELSQFNTIEMMEWQRIVRMRGNLSRVEDIHGRPMFSDEQMITYLRQFERDFAKAPQRIIDTTEGGQPKQHTETATLAEAIAELTSDSLPDLPLPDRQLDPDRLQRVHGLLTHRLDELEELRSVSRSTVAILEKMQKSQKDKQKMLRLFEKLKINDGKVHGPLKATFDAVNSLNTIGVFRRQAADRKISHITDDFQARQAGQLKRDIENIDWLLQACDEAESIFTEALERTRRLMPEPASVAA
ncbi:motility associated factor glycosyltransferase family protein [Mucisphaera sp.]|uniref:motility associated factor glycosyltransferase family protein n=1 Tax=Mucisphaera sp. TaxID=2913024 RepID=UPI003D0B9C1F